jgi:thiol:disulfide interchange protein DsbD
MDFRNALVVLLAHWILVGPLPAQETVGPDQVSDPAISDVAAPGKSRQDQVVQFLTEQGLVPALGMIFLLGLALNLTPCVYPMVSLTVMYFVRQAEGKTKRVVVQALWYLLGIALTYSALGMLAALTGRMFGAHLQNPWVLAGIALVVVALSLGMFGVFQLRLPAFVIGLSESKASRILGALGMGLFVGLIAAPCVGPVTVGLLLYVGAQGDPWEGWLMFFVLALGLGSPYVALAVFSDTLHKLPKAGDWTVWVERLFGFLLLGLALYLVSPLLADWLEPWLTFALAASAGVYLGWLEKSGSQGGVFSWFKKVTGVALVILGIMAVISQPTPQQEIDWRPYDPAVLEQAKKDGRPVILDFYAEWCPPCQEMDRTTWRDERVIAVAAEFVMVKVDLTQAPSSEVERLAEKYQVTGIPTLVFLDHRGHERENLRSAGYLGPDDFLKQVRNVRTAR